MARKRRSDPDGVEMREAPSRSAKKRESAARQKIGESLIKLSPEERRGLPLSEDLLEALSFCDSLSDKEALRRQRQYIGKLMREADTPAIMAALGKMENPHAAQMARFHAAERWREKMLADPIAGAAAFWERQPGLAPDAGAKRDLISLAERASQAGSGDPALKRSLFRLILGLLEKAAG